MNRNERLVTMDSDFKDIAGASDLKVEIIEV